MLNRLLKNLVILAVFALPLMAQASLPILRNEASKEKIYVELSDLVVDSMGFWLRTPINSLTIVAKSLHVDSFGYYLDKSGVQWICYRCKAINEDISNRTCQSCGLLN